MNLYKQQVYAIYENEETTTIQYVITNKCNLNCSYCPKKFLYDQSNFDNIDKFIEDTKTFYNNNKENTKGIEIYITGGEPLTDFKAIEYLLKKLARLDFIKNIIIFSNGILLTPTIIKKLNILKAVVDFKFYLTIHPSSTGLSKVKYLNTITKFAKFFISKMIILNKDYFEEFINNLDTYSDYEVQPNMIDTDELLKLKELSFERNKSFVYNNIPLDIIDLYISTRFNFKGWTCSAGKSYFIYNREKLYTCATDYHKKKEIQDEFGKGVPLNEYIIKPTICENTKCACEQSLHKRL